LKEEIVITDQESFLEALSSNSNKMSLKIVVEV